jgi:hypothetical protein
MAGSTSTVVKQACTGVALFALINFVVGFAMFAQGIGTSISARAEAIAAVILAVVAFGCGGGLLAIRRPWAKGLGIGLMIGWAIMSVVSLGFCTGINPEVYSS